LPKKCDGFTGHEIEFACQVNSYKAPLKWYKDDEELRETSDGKYVFGKDIIGNATLLIRGASKGDSGTYKCRIENTKLVTKCVLSVAGALGAVVNVSYFRSYRSSLASSSRVHSL
jgi:hypothetical protein